MMMMVVLFSVFFFFCVSRARLDLDCFGKQKRDRDDFLKKTFKSAFFV
tara:strand:+ start:963 stop:1106 length:144 start_codon:yes stop_codon:yes gene_type:complete